MRCSNLRIQTRVNKPCEWLRMARSITCEWVFIASLSRLLESEQFIAIQTFGCVFFSHEFFRRGEDWQSDKHGSGNAQLDISGVEPGTPLRLSSSGRRECVCHSNCSVEMLTKVAGGRFAFRDRDGRRSGRDEQQVVVAWNQNPTVQTGCMRQTQS